MVQPWPGWASRKMPKHPGCRIARRRDLERNVEYGSDPFALLERYSVGGRGCRLQMKSRIPRPTLAPPRCADGRFRHPSGPSRRYDRALTMASGGKTTRDRASGRHRFRIVAREPEAATGLPHPPVRSLLFGLRPSSSCVIRNFTSLAITKPLFGKGQ